MSLSELVVKLVGDLNPTSEVSIPYFLRVQSTDKPRSYEHLFCALYAVPLASLRIFIRTCTECVTNTAEFLIVNFHLINRRYYIILSSLHLYAALRVLFGGSSAERWCTNHDLSYGVVFRMQSGDLSSLMNFLAVIVLIKSFVLSLIIFVALHPRSLAAMLNGLWCSLNMIREPRRQDSASSP
jgi:hypothetical protein